jgi:hypothetical protein
MTSFGLIKTKIEKKLSDSYQNETFKTEFSRFKKLVLENKKISKVLFLYNELIDNKNLSESNAKEFVTECINSYKSINLKQSDLNLLENWLKNTTCKNKYSDIDTIFSNDVLKLVEKVESKNRIVEGLRQSQPKTSKSQINLPIKSMVQIANKTFAKHIESLTEGEKKELMGVLTISDDELKDSFNKLKEDTIQKLNLLNQKESDSEIKSKVDETISKIQNENVDRLNYFKLKKLNETI